LGALQTIAVRLVPMLVRRLLSDQAPVRIELREDVNDAPMLAELEAGLLDFALVMLPIDERRFQWVEVVEDPYLLVAPRGDRRAREISSLDDLDGVPMIGRSTCRCWEIVAAQLHAAGVEPNYVFRSDDAFSVIGHVRSGLGLAIVSQLTVEMVNTEDIEVVSLGGSIAPRRLALAWNRDREHSPAESRLLDVTRDLAIELRRAQRPPRRLVAAAG
jgi:LysR family hydrogen peroxide-inducible transcriptional activator